MIKQFLKDKGRKKPERENADRLLSLQIDEIEELSALLMSRIDERVKDLKELEERIDAKMKDLQRLIARAEELSEESVPDFTDYRVREVMVLASKGLRIDEIATILDLPAGEIELILSMQE